MCRFANILNLQVLGRHVRDFVNGLDNLHEYLRFSYPKVQPPTFFCQEESATGVTLHYRWDNRTAKTNQAERERGFCVEGVTHGSAPHLQEQT